MWTFLRTWRPLVRRKCRDALQACETTTPEPYMNVKPRALPCLEHGICIHERSSSKSLYHSNPRSISVASWSLAFALTFNIRCFLVSQIKNVFEFSYPHSRLNTRTAPRTPERKPRCRSIYVRSGLLGPGNTCCYYAGHFKTYEKGRIRC